MHASKKYILPGAEISLTLKLHDVDYEFNKTQWIDAVTHTSMFWLVHLSSGHQVGVWQPHAVSLIISQLLQVGSRQHCKAGCPLLQRHVIQILLSIGPVPVGTQDVTVGTQDVTVGTQDSTVGTQDATVGTKWHAGEADALTEQSCDPL